MSYTTKKGANTFAGVALISGSAGIIGLAMSFNEAAYTGFEQAALMGGGVASLALCGVMSVFAAKGLIKTTPHKPKFEHLPLKPSALNKK